MRAVPFALSAVLLAGAAHAQVVSTEGGNIVVRQDDGRTTAITSGGKDSEPVMSPDQRLVVFTREGKKSKAMEGCSGGADNPDHELELWSIGIDGKNARRLLATRIDDDVQKTICGFRNKQFNIEGTALYFETPAWATSNALHVLDLQSGTERFFVAGSDFGIVTCTGSPYADHVSVLQHRYFVQGGSYDWFWLYAPDGKEVGPFGEEPPSVAEFCGE